MGDLEVGKVGVRWRTVFANPDGYPARVRALTKHQTKRYAAKRRGPFWALVCHGDRCRCREPAIYTGRRDRPRRMRSIARPSMSGLRR